MNQQFRIAKQMIDMQRVSVDGTINGMITMWEQTAVMLEGAAWLPKEGRNALRQWADVNKKACEDLKTIIAAGYSNLDSLFGVTAQE